MNEVTAERHKAMLWETQPDDGGTDTVRCNLCAHRCLVREGRKGICLVRENVRGNLFTLVYGRAVSANVDPVEKKPLFHFYPGTNAFSIARSIAWCATTKPRPRSPSITAAAAVSLTTPMSGLGLM